MDKIPFRFMLSRITFGPVSTEILQNFCSAVPLLTLSDWIKEQSALSRLFMTAWHVHFMS